MDNVFEETHWGISIDAADDTYSPFSENTELLSLHFGVFDDSFMHQYHSSDNLPNWNFFERDRYLESPAGGEFSYLSSYDEQNALNEHVGAYGTAFEEWVEEFNMTYINGNDKNQYHTLDRIKEAGRYMGYKFKINSFLSKDGESMVEVENVGVAPIYYDAYVTVNGVRADETLKLLAPRETITCNIPSGGSNPILTVESDRILDTQTIGFYGTENEPFVYVKEEVEEEVMGVSKGWMSDLLVTANDGNLYISQKPHDLKQMSIYNLMGKKLYSNLSMEETDMTVISLQQATDRVLIIKTNLGSMKFLLN